MSRFSLQSLKTGIKNSIQEFRSSSRFSSSKLVFFLYFHCFQFLLTGIMALYRPHGSGLMGPPPPPPRRPQWHSGLNIPTPQNPFHHPLGHERLPEPLKVLFVHIIERRNLSWCVGSANGAYYPNWAVYKQGPPSSLNLACISHVFYAFAHVKQDGTVFVRCALYTVHELTIC